MSVKKLLSVEGGWTCVKEVLWWIIDAWAGTVTLPDLKLQELQDLLAIPTTQRQMGRKELERLVRTLCSLHLLVPGAVSYI